MIPIVLLYLLRLCASQGGPDAQYVLNFDSQLLTCDEESAAFVDTSNVFVERYNDTDSYMYGVIEFFQDIGENTMVELILAKETSGKYEVLCSHDIWDFCDEISIGVESDYHKYLKYVGFPEKCPFVAGKYPVKELVVSSEEVPVNSNTYGRYISYLKLYDVPNKEKREDKTFMFCVFLKLIIELE